MERHNFVREGVSRLPPGFRFQPTDEELVFEYLKSKIFSLPLPASIIPELNFSKFDPWDLPGDPEEERYFFTKKEAKYRSGNRTNRATSSGYWKATGSDKHVTPPHGKRLGIPMKGLRKTFVFHRGKSPNGCRTDWFMHEYSLVLNGMSSTSDHIVNSMNNKQICEATPRIENWIICCVYLKPRLDKDYDEPMFDSRDNYQLTTNAMNANEMGRHLNTTIKDNSLVYHTSYSSSSSSSSNSVAENSSYESEYDDETSSYYY